MAAKISFNSANEAAVLATNLEGTRNVIQACIDNHVHRLVNISSIRAFNLKPHDQAIDESSELISANAGFAYDRSKAESVREVEAASQRGLDAINIFPTSLLGPYDLKLSDMTKFFLDLYHGEIPLLIEGGFNYVDIRDVASAILCAGEQGRKGERYLLGGYYTTLRDFAAIAEEITGKKSPRIFLPIGLIKTMAPLINFYARITNHKELRNLASPITLDALSHYGEIRCDKSIRELHFHARPIRDSIDDIYSWFGEYGLLKN
jgi:dihydroflavonol-4-reductase